MRLPQHRIVAVIVAVMVLALAGIAIAQSDPVVGTWKLNTAKSRYDPGPTPKSNMITITAIANGIHVVAKGENGAGQPTGVDYTTTYDGKDSPVKGAPAYDMVSTKKIDANTTETVRKKDGKQVQTVMRKISADGKMMTVTTQGKDEKGRTLNTVAVYDKQ
jgi:hypothetical protein